MGGQADVQTGGRVDRLAGWTEGGGSGRGGSVGWTDGRAGGWGTGWLAGLMDRWRWGTDKLGGLCGRADARTDGRIDR